MERVLFEVSVLGAGFMVFGSDVWFWTWALGSGVGAWVSDFHLRIVCALPADIAAQLVRRTCRGGCLFLEVKLTEASIGLLTRSAGMSEAARSEP